jgi:hypothetical protein
MPAITETAWWGFRLQLSQPEACIVALATGTASLVAAVKIPQPYGTLVAGQLYIYQDWIRSKAESSGGQGILIKVSWTGFILGIKRLGTGSSPCAAAPATPTATPVTSGRGSLQPRLPLKTKVPSTAVFDENDEPENAGTYDVNTGVFTRTPGLAAAKAKVLDQATRELQTLIQAKKASFRGKGVLLTGVMP